jgi:adenylosuccinate lyase
MIERYSRPAMKKIWSDENKFGKWLEVEVAVCDAWAELEVIPRSALTRIKMAKCDFKRMEELLQETHHDMTAFLGSVAESVGEEARYIHLGLTSSDVMDTAMSLQLVEATDLLQQDVGTLIDVLARKALQYKYTPMIGRTHGVHAEPTSFGLKIAIWFDEMRRNRERLIAAQKVIAYGKISGAVGTYATLTPELEEKALAHLKLTPAPVSNQVLQRDRHAQFVTTLALIACSLEKFATEIRLLQKTESREVEEPFSEGQTGSSAMPHKRNPELAERICGQARLMRGYALAAMEDVPLWHERDISHSSTERIIIPDSCLLLDYMLNLFTGIIKGLNVYPKKMARDIGITHGLVYSQRVMLALIDKGLSRQDAYKLTQRNAMRSWQDGKPFLKLLEADEDVMKAIPKTELAALFDVQYYLRFVDDIFKRLGLTEGQWKEKGAPADDNRLAPRTI